MYYYMNSTCCCSSTVRGGGTGSNANLTLTCVGGELKAWSAARPARQRGSWKIFREMQQTYHKQRNDNLSKPAGTTKPFVNHNLFLEVWFTCATSPLDTASLLAFLIPLAVMMTMPHPNSISKPRLCYHSQASHPRITSHQAFLIHRCHRRHPQTSPYPTLSPFHSPSTSLLPCSQSSIPVSLPP